MHRPLVVAVAIALAGLATPTSHLSSGDVAAAEKGDGCPGKLGSLRLTSSGVGEENANKGEAWCLYRSKDYSKNVVIRAKWLVKSASPVWLSDLEQSYCLRTDEDYVGPGQHGDKTRSGNVFPHAGDLYILAGYLATEKGPSVGRIREVARELASEYAGLAAACPGAAEPDSAIDGSPANVTDSADADEDTPAVDSSITVTTIVLSGGPDEEPPVVGTTIEVPEDDQHQLVVGGPDGDVIREEFIGDQATIGAYGPLVTDADGNWSVLVTVDVSTAPEPTSLPSPGPSSTTAPAPAPTPTPIPGASSPEPTTVPATPWPSPEPAAASPPIAPTEVPGSMASPTAVPPPQLVGVPDKVADLVAKLPPEGAGAVRNLTDRLAGLAEDLDESGKGTVEIPASDIESLRALAPGLIKEVWPTEGSIVITTTKPNIGSILVIPEKGADGLITVRLNRLRWIELSPLVRTLVATLNSYVDKHDGRFTEVSVTPEGLVITAERKASE